MFDNRHVGMALLIYTGYYADPTGKGVALVEILKGHRQNGWGKGRGIGLMRKNE